MANQIINQLVEITQVAFRGNMQAYPRRMEYQGTTYHFVDQGIHCTVQSGGRASHIVSLSDGRDTFHLRNSGGRGGWTLLSISS